ncbi:MAG: hypothetical protein RLZZ488_1041 [Pseudomonadota bacterium]|jgi:hypothetical protein
MKKHCSIIFSGLMLPLFLVGACKAKDPSLDSDTSVARESRKFEWCKPSASALSSLLESIDTMEKAGKTEIRHSPSGGKTASLPPPKSVIGLLDKPPHQEPPPCGQDFDHAMRVNSEYIAILSNGELPSVALNAAGSGCTVESSSGILSVTKIPGGGYMIELMGCGGRTRSEMIIPQADLIKFARSILRGV